jgi:hypothetical protein
MSWTVGQTVYVTPSYTRGVVARLRKATITKVGRRWVSLSNGSLFDAANHRVDDNSNGGRVYVTPDAFSTERYCSELVRRIYRECPQALERLTSFELDGIAALLNVAKPEREAPPEICE